MQMEVAAHEIFTGQPVGPLHAIGDDDRTVCEDFGVGELMLVQASLGRTRSAVGVRLARSTSRLGVWRTK